MQRITAVTVTCTLFSILLATGCGATQSGRLSGNNGNSTESAAATPPSSNATASPIKPGESNIGAKGVNSNISAKQQTQAQAAVNQLVTTINQLH